MRRVAKTLVGLVVVVFFLTVASSARADDFSWTFSSSGLSGSGTLTTGAFSSGQAKITGITGTFGGLTITGLAPYGSFGGYGDNILFYPATPYYLDFYGVVFYLTDTNVLGNIWYNVNSYAAQTDNYGNFGTQVSGGFSVTPISTPEPGTLLLLGSGLLALGLLAGVKRYRGSGLPTPV